MFDVDATETEEVIGLPKLLRVILASPNTREDGASKPDIYFLMDVRSLSHVISETEKEAQQVNA